MEAMVYTHITCVCTVASGTFDSRGGALPHDGLGDDLTLDFRLLNQVIKVGL